MDRPKLVAILRYVLLVIVVGFAVAYFWSQWAEIVLVLAEIPFQSVLLSVVLVSVGVIFGTASWVTILNGLGPRVPVLRAAQVLLVGQLGKYVPGSIWSYVMQMELGRQYGILRPRVLVTALYAAGIGVVASLVLGGLALPAIIANAPALVWLFALLPIGLLCLHPRIMTLLANSVLRIFRRPPLTHEVRFVTVVLSLVWALCAYACYGLHVWVLVNALSAPSFSDLLVLTGAIALSFSASVFVFFLPSGIGVRELILIGSMTLMVSAVEASAISLVSRGLFTLVDLLAAGAAVALVLLRRRALAVETESYLLDEAVYESGESQGANEL